MIPVVAIDGPSGAGKGTISRLVAESTGYALLDSGALYRLVGVAGRRAGLDLEVESEVAKIASSMKVSFVPKGEKTLVLLDGEDVSTDIRTESAGMGASKVAAYPKVREALLQYQRDFCQAPGLVADGRDMGTVVFPNAPVKIFLTASAEERARRRIQQLRQAGQEEDYEQVLADIQRRDYQDTHRASAPLIPAEDAIQLDSTSLDIQAVFAIVMKHIAENISDA